MKTGINPQKLDNLFLSLVVVIVVAHVLVNHQAGLSFPTPWLDEAHFLWQAHSISENNTLFSPELNTERTIMWMPPGYMILMGLIFKVTGASLELPRILSLVAIISFFILLVSFLSRFANRWIVLTVASLFFLNARFVACGNIARMEALLLLAIILAFTFIQRGRVYIGLSILGLTPLIHFNGFFFALSGLAHVLYSFPRQKWYDLINRKLLLTIAVILAGWIAYAFLIHANWDSFVVDMKYQFHRKGKQSVWQELCSVKYILPFLIVILGGIYAKRSSLKAVELLFLAVPALLIWPVGHEFWYEVVDHIAFLIISIFVISILVDLIIERKIIVQKWLKYSLVVLFLFGVLWWNYDGKRIENIFHYQKSSELMTMKLFPEVRYINADERERLSELLVKLSRERNGITVEFEPQGDGLLFMNLENEGVHFVCPLFQERLANVLVIHISRDLPEWWGFGKQAAARYGLTGKIKDHLWYTRDSTELWFVAVLPDN